LSALVKAPVVFISYACEGPRHERWVMRLATRMLARGIDTILDKWDLKAGQDVARFMEQSYQRADHVLLVCTETYVQRVNERVRGVGYEATVFIGDLIGSQNTDKLICLVRQTPGADVKLPSALRTKRYLDFSLRRQFTARFEELELAVNGMSAVKKPALGPNPYVSRASDA
jgi:hypothetical protein